MTRLPRQLLQIALLTTAAAGCYSWRNSLLPAVARWLDVGDRPRPSDYVMILGGDQKFRPEVAAALVQEGLARQVLLAPALPSAGPEAAAPLPYHERMRSVLMHAGVAGNAILILDKPVASTYDEAAALAAFLQARPAARVTVVTSGYHTRRARWIFSQVLGPRQNCVSFVSAPADWAQPDTWWQAGSGRETILWEYAKMAFYLLRYGRLAPVL
jgi:uncharacterized SAM-binding protein YcdF (DUF218 family)